MGGAVTIFRALILAAVLSLARAAGAAQAAPATPAAAQATPAAAPVDPVLTAAQNLVGRALFLRGFYASDTLSYGSGGQLLSTSAPTDWTLAAVNVLKATRPRPDAIALEGVRVAIRYNPDAHEFQRHPLNDEKVKIVVQLVDGGDTTARQLESAFAAMFAIGIDPALQRSMPPLWRHYFDPSVAWSAADSADPLASATIYPIPPLPGPPAEVVPPILAHQTASQFTGPARHDRVQGTVQLRMVVDGQGMPQRIAVTRPLGYGLDREAVEAVENWRFNPALHAGQPVAAAILVNIDFVPPPVGR
jgi:TonB family protein